MAPTTALKRAAGVGGPAAILAGAVGWTFVSAAASGGSPAGVAGVLSASAASLILAAAAGGRDSRIVPAVVVVAAALLALASGGEILSSQPAKGPFSYANATGAFYVQATIAGLMLVAAARTALGRWLGGAGAAAFAAITVASGSRAAAALLLLPAGAFVAFRLRAGRIAVRALAGVLVVVAFVTVVLGATYEPPRSPSRGEGARTRSERVPDDRRLALWHEALRLVEENPITGVGPGRFAEESPIASADPDARWAHHGFLQFGAETGMPGLVLLVLAHLWAIATVARRTMMELLCVLGVAAVVSFGVGACLDYLMHFPAIPVATAALTGAAVRVARSDDVHLNQGGA